MRFGLKVDDIEFSSATLVQFPEHAAAIGRIVNTSSMIEGVVGGIYGVVKHEAIEDAMAELKEMRTNRKRVDAVQAALELSPPQVHAIETGLVLKRVLGQAEARNKVAHGIWGNSPDKQGTLYHLPVKKLVPFAATVVSNGTAGTPLAGLDTLKAAMSCYTLADLQKIVEDGEALLIAVFECFTIIGQSAAVGDGWEQTTNPVTGEPVLRSPPGASA